AAFGCRHVLDFVVTQLELAENGIVEDLNSVGGDGAHGKLLVAGHAELAYEEDIERCPELPGDFVADGHAAARQREYDHVVAAGIVKQFLGQFPAGLGSIEELHDCTPAWKSASHVPISGGAINRGRDCTNRE